MKALHYLVVIRLFSSCEKKIVENKAKLSFSCERKIVKNEAKLSVFETGFVPSYLLCLCMVMKIR